MKLTPLDQRRHSPTFRRQQRGRLTLTFRLCRVYCDGIFTTETQSSQRVCSRRYSHWIFSAPSAPPRLATRKPEGPTSQLLRWCLTAATFCIVIDPAYAVPHGARHVS